MPNLTRSRSSTLTERNRTKSSATHFLTNGTELKVPLQKVSEPTRNRREISLFLPFPKKFPELGTPLAKYPDQLIWFRLCCFAFHRYLLALQFRPSAFGVPSCAACRLALCPCPCPFLKALCPSFSSDSSRAQISRFLRCRNLEVPTLPHFTRQEHEKGSIRSCNCDSNKG